MLDQLEELEVCLKALVNNAWIITRRSENINLVLLSMDPSNPIIKKSISINLNGEIKIFVHGLPVPETSEVWNTPFELDTTNIHSIADYVAALALNVIDFKICSGDQEYDHYPLWETVKASVGAVDKKDPYIICFRSAKCHLLLNKFGSCCECRKETTNFVRQMNRRIKLSERTTDSSKVNYRFMSKEEMESLTRTYYRGLKVEKQRNQRLRKKLSQVMKESSVKVSENLNNDLLDIMKEKYPTMSATQQLFWEEQLKYLECQKNPRAMRWSPMMIRVALSIKSFSLGGYKYLQAVGIGLPSTRRLYDYTHYMEAKEGCQEEITLDIKKKIDKNCAEKHERFCNVQFDEMNVRSNLVWKNGELIGYVKLNEVETELKKMSVDVGKYEPPRAKKILTFMVTGCVASNSVCDVVAIFSTAELSAFELSSRTWEVVYHLESFEIPVLCLIFDGASVNRRFLHMHHQYEFSNEDEDLFITPTDVVFATKNLACGEPRPIYFILDPPHLIKTIRNCLANSYGHRSTRNLWKNGEDMKWKAIEVLYESSIDKKFPGHKLTKAHVKLTAFSKMTVRLATQVISNSVRKCLLKKKDDPKFKDIQILELSIFIEMMHKFFDCLNSRKRKEGEELTSPDREPFYSPDDERLIWLGGEFLSYLKKWEDDVTNRPGNFTKEQRRRMLLSSQTVEGIKITVQSFIRVTRFLLKSGVQYVEGREFNQDRLEQYFGKLREKGGSNDNPDLAQALDMRQSLHVQQGASIPKLKGNTEVLRSAIEVDDTPLPARKKRKTED